MGVGNILSRNKALIAKLLWRFPLESDSLWGKVIKSKYGLRDNGWDTLSSSRVTFRSPWKFIASCLGVFEEHVYFKVGVGDRIRFWEDV